jgi:signal peptidase
MTTHGTMSDSRALSLRSFVNGLMVVFVLTALGLAALVRGVPLSGGMTLVVAGPSMTPGLSVGSVVVVEPVEPTALAVGDVVSVQNGPSRAIFTHRIVRLIQRDGTLWLETKGDANPAPDPSIVPASGVLGRVVLALPYVGYAVALGSHPSGVILIVALGLLLLVAQWILDPKPTMGLAGQPA